MVRRTLRIHLPINEIVNRYSSGESVNSLAKDYSVSRGAITTRLIRANIKLRTQSESEKAKWVHMTADQRKRQVKAAHDSIRGRRKTREFLIRKAKGVQAKAKLSQLENLFLATFGSSGIKVIPLYALDIFNLDFAIPDVQLAIEIDSGHWHESDRKVKQDRKKEAFLEENG